jgi:hypothetical protein
MKSGCSLIVRSKHTTQENLRTMAKQAETWVFDFLWANDHLILPPLTTSRYRGTPKSIRHVMPQFPAAVREAGRALAEIEISLKVRLRFGEGEVCPAVA